MWNVPHTCYPVGSLATQCYPDCFPHGMAHVVVVEGDMPNAFGHVLLGDEYNYFHVAGPTHTSRVLTLSTLQYQMYLQSSGKQELTRHLFRIPYPNGARQRLETWISNPYWKYNMIHHNCAHFVQDILEAGHVDTFNFSRIPTMIS